MSNLSTNYRCTDNLISFSGDKRHDIYLQLIGGYFHKGTKKADKNVEITFTIVDGEGKPIPVCQLFCYSGLYVWGYSLEIYYNNVYNYHISSNNLTRTTLLHVGGS